MQIIKTASILLVAVFWSTYAIAETSNVDVTITSVDSKQSSITVSYDGKSRQLKLAPAALFEIDGKEGSLGSLLPGDMAVVTYDREKSLVTRITVQRDAMIPADKLPEGWDQIDQRLLFLMVRLANVETSLDAIEQVIDGQSRRSTARSADAKRADRANEELDRKGGGPVKWSQFYGMTAEQFFYHPTDRNSTYHTVTVLNQQGSQADNKVGGGVPASQGLPVHQRPPQFDYIYKANERAKARAEADASELRGKMEQLSARRQRLEAEQAGLWVEIAFRAISHYDLDTKPLYRFEPLMMASDTDSRKRIEAMKSASIFMAMALSIIKDAENNQAATFTRIKPMVAEARQVLSDTYVKLALDVSDRRSSIGRFAALAKRLEDVASNLTDSYVVAMEGDSAKDQQRKETFRATLQGSLLNYAQIVLAMDEMSSQLQYEYGYQPDTEKPIRLVGLRTIDTDLKQIAFPEKNVPQISRLTPHLAFMGEEQWAVKHLNHPLAKKEKISWVFNEKEKTIIALGDNWNCLQSKEVFSDFRLEFDWRWTPGTSSYYGSGIVIHSSGISKEDKEPNGLQILFNHGNQVGYLIPREVTLSIDPKYRTMKNQQNGLGSWNNMHVDCKGERVSVFLNGVLVNEGFGMKMRSGNICLMNCDSAIEFRNFSIIRYPAD